MTPFAAAEARLARLGRPCAPDAPARQRAAVAVRKKPQAEVTEVAVVPLGTWHVDLDEHPVVLFCGRVEEAFQHVPTVIVYGRLCFSCSWVSNL